MLEALYGKEKMNELKDIYFLNAKELALEIKNKTLSDYRIYKHFLATLLLGGLSIEIPFKIKASEIGFSGYEVTTSIIAFIVGAIIIFYGTRMVYQANEQGDGKDFITRFIILGLPVGLQIVLLFVWLGLIFAAISLLLVEGGGATGAIIVSILSMIFFISFVIMFYFRMRKFILIAAGVNE